MSDGIAADKNLQRPREFGRENKPWAIAKFDVGGEENGLKMLCMAWSFGHTDHLIIKIKC